MIKILPNNTTVTLKAIHMRKTAQGNLGENTKQCNFTLDKVNFRVRWNGNSLQASIQTDEQIYIESIELTFKLKFSKSYRETTIWTESYLNDCSNEDRDCLPGVQTQKQARRGAWAMWIGDSQKSDGIFFSQEIPAYHPLLFFCHPFRHKLSIKWLINRQMKQGQNISLSSVGFYRGEKNTLIDNWRKTWVITKKWPVKITKGWLGDGALSSLQDIRESANRLKSLKMGFGWFAITPNYASDIGDWLELKDEFRNRMSNVSRAITEAGLLPGLQFAPFLVGKNSQTAKKNPGWLLLNEKGNPVTVRTYFNAKDLCYVLDTTNPEVKNYLTKLLRTMKDKWGFQVFIIERIIDISALGRRYDNSLAVGELIAEIAELIREILGDTATLIARDIPLLAAPHVWDIQTLSEQALPNFLPHKIMNIISVMLHRADWNKKTWLNAAAPLPVEFFCSTGNTANSSLLSALPVSSGSVILSGDPRILNKNAQTELKKFMRYFESCRKGQVTLASQSAKEEAFPLIVRNDCGQVALFNISSQAQSVHLDLEVLRNSYGMGSPLSINESTVFHSSDIHVSLAPWGHRLFRG